MLKDYEQMFSSVCLKGNINWNELDDFVILAYAAITFKQIAKNNHDYEKEPILIYQKMGQPRSYDLIEPTNYYYIFPSPYFSALLKHNPFFQRLHGQQVLYRTTLTELKFEHRLTQVQTPQDAYHFLKERFPNEVYAEEVAEIFQLVKPYCDILDEQKVLENIQAKPSKSIKEKQKI